MKFRSEKYVPLILILLNILLAFLIFDPRLFLGGDNVTFIILAHSLLEGQGYRDLSNPDKPVFIGSPPGYPVFLTFLMLIFGNSADVILFKLASLGLSCITLYFFYRILQTLSLGRIFSLVASLLVVVNFNILYPNHLELSDVLFNTFLFASLYFFISGRKNGNLIGIILAVMATYTRYAGLVLVLALLAYLLIKKQYKKFWSYGILSFGLILPWAVYVIAHGFALTDILTGAPYAAQRKLLTMGELGQRWLENFQTYFLSYFPVDLFSWIAPPIWVGIIVTLAILVGWFLKIRAKLSALELYFIFYILLILSWPQVWSGERYILPVIYLVIFYLAYALYRLAKSKVFLMVTGIILLYNAYVIAKLVPLTLERFQAFQQGNIAQYYPQDWLSFFKCCNWVNENIPQEAVIVSRKPNMLFFQTRNQGFVYPFSENPDSVYQKIAQADYILTDNFQWTTSTKRYLVPAIYKYQDKFEILYKVPDDDFYVLRVKK